MNIDDLAEKMRREPLSLVEQQDMLDSLNSEFEILKQQRPQKYLEAMEKITQFIAQLNLVEHTFAN